VRTEVRGCVNFPTDKVVLSKLRQIIYAELISRWRRFRSVQSCWKL